MTYVIEITRVASRAVVVTRFHVSEAELGSSMGQRMGAAFGTVMAQIGRAHLTAQAPAVACYERAGDGFDVAAGFPVAEPFEAGGELDRFDLPAGEVAHTTHLGPYEGLSGAYDALRAFVEAQGRALSEAAPPWEEYWTGPEAPPEENRTEIYWPLAAAG